MRTLATPRAIRAAVRRRRADGERIGFVPTMGALHDGHRSLLRRARGECDCLVASIFVNPLQFGPNEDYRRYPRPARADAAILRAEGVDLLYRPAVATLYPEGHETRVGLPRLGSVLEGRFRAGHFDGVATVVAKLLCAVEPDRLYLGQKDAQQAAVLRRMTRDLDFGVRVVVCPTARERDGLALSSRNAYLTREQRIWAPAIYAALKEAGHLVRQGSRPAHRAAERLLARRLAGGPGRLDYASVVDPETLGPPRARGDLLIAVAYRLPQMRLIDNLIVRRGGER